MALWLCVKSQWQSQDALRYPERGAESTHSEFEGDGEQWQYRETRFQRPGATRLLPAYSSSEVTQNGDGQLLSVAAMIYLGRYCSGPVASAC